MGFSRQEYWWVAMPSSQGTCRLRDRTLVSYVFCVGRWVLYHCAVLSHWVMSDSLGPHRLQPARLLCPWDSPGKNTGVSCHALLWGLLLAPLVVEVFLLLVMGFMCYIPISFSLGKCASLFKRNMVSLHRTDEFWEVINALKVVFVGVKQMVSLWTGPS